MVTMIVSLSFQRVTASGPPKKERGFYATCKSCASFSTWPPPGKLWRPAALERAHELAQPAALHALHDALHLQELLQQPVHVLDLHPRAPGNAPASRAVEYRRVTPLAGGHGIDDGDLPPQLPIPLVRRHGALPGHRPGKLVEQRTDASHPLQLLELTLQIHHVEALALECLARQALGFLDVDLAVNLFDQAHDIAHAENA